jgi:tRNA(Phe) wybutosine-synthesizing methylase Tyw3
MKTRKEEVTTWLRNMLGRGEAQKLRNALKRIADYYKVSSCSGRVAVS